MTRENKSAGAAEERDEGEEVGERRGRDPAITHIVRSVSAGVTSAPALTNNARALQNTQLTVNSLVNQQVANMIALLRVVAHMCVGPMKSLKSPHSAKLLPFTQLGGGTCKTGKT